MNACLAFVTITALGGNEIELGCDLRDGHAEDLHWDAARDLTWKEGSHHC